MSKDYKHALDLDKKFGHNRWFSSVALELDQINKHNAFLDLGMDGVPPEECKLIKVHLVFDAKYDGRHKARLVVNGHMNNAPLDSACSGAASLRGFRMVLFLSELNELETWAANVRNACLESLCAKLACMIAGPEFGKREGHTLVLHKALCGIRTSGAS